MPRSFRSLFRKRLVEQLRDEIPTSLNLQKLAAGSLEHDRGQGVAVGGAGIDIDPVRQVLRGRYDGMPMDDDAAMVVWAVRKGLANPDQVFPPLLIEGDARANSGMGEEVVSFPMPKLQAMQQLLMRQRHAAAQFLRYRFRRLGGIDAVAATGCVTAMEQPECLHPRDALQTAEQHFLMIAQEADLLEALRRPCQQTLDHATRIGTAIDIVAQVDQEMALGRMFLRILANVREQEVKQRRFTMNVPNCIDPRAFRHGVVAHLDPPGAYANRRPSSPSRMARSISSSRRCATSSIRRCQIEVRVRRHRRSRPLVERSMRLSTPAVNWPERSKARSASTTRAS